MNASELSQYLCETFKGVDFVLADDCYFFFYNPTLPPDHKFPFVTIVTSDIYDQYSDLKRPDVFRLNIGITKETFQALFGISAHEAMENAIDRYDYTALDQIMPHPEYGQLNWVCVNRPSDAVFNARVEPLLVEAYTMTVDRYLRQHPTDSQ
jgi:hypothetical protein